MPGSLTQLLPQHLQDAAKQADELVAQGYRTVSRKYGTVARIDRPDWKAHLKRGGHHGGGHPGMLEDQYRRVFSRDKLTVSREVLSRIPSSGFAVTGYHPKPNETESAAPKTNRLISNGSLETKLFDGPAVLNKGTVVEVARLCCDSVPGSRGEVAGWKWVSGKQDPYVRVYFGENAGGYKLFKLFPSNVLRVVADDPIRPAATVRLRP